VLEDDDRDLIQPQLLRRHQPAVTGDDHLVIAHQDRVDEAELGDAPRDLADLLLRVGPRVFRIGSQPVERPVLDRFDVGGWHLTGQNKMARPSRPTVQLLWLLLDLPHLLA